MIPIVTIDIQDREVLDYLGQLQRKLGDMTPVMDAIGQRLEEQVSGRFETESDPNGAAWKPHPIKGYPWVYDKYYPKDGNRKLLDRSGDMLRSLGHQADASSVLVGFGQHYAAYHEFGTKHMQRRGLLTADPDSRTLGEDDRRAILDLVASYLST